MSGFWHFTIGDVVAFVGIAVPAWLGLFSLVTILRDYRPHKHIEKKGPLHAEGLSYPRSMNGDA